MNSIKALAATEDAITVSQVGGDLYVHVEFLDYLRWLADQDTGLRVSIGQIWELYFEGVREGRAWADVCEDVGLPIRHDW